MSLPASKELASLVFSEKANQLAHDNIGARGRKLTNGLLVLSTVLGYLAGVGGLADLVGKVWVSVIALAAGISTTFLILAFTTLKSSDHLRIAGEYEQLYLGTVRIDDERTREGESRLQELRVAFDQVVEKTRIAGTALTTGQVAKYEKEARAAMRMDLGRGRDPNAEEAELLAPRTSSLSGKPRASATILNPASGLTLSSVNVRGCMPATLAVVTQLVTQFLCPRVSPVDALDVIRHQIRRVCRGFLLPGHMQLTRRPTPEDSWPARERIGAATQRTIHQR